jgi:hypothetical protein
MPPTNRMLAFLTLLVVALVVYLITKEQEGFEPKIKPSVDAVAQRLSSLPEKTSDTKGADPAPSAPSATPGTLPIAPFEQTATMSPLPYQDTTETKANRQQLVNALEMLKGFLAYEAQNLEERSDPAIQLPLQTARSDFYSLQNEVSVLNRNPGVQPTITLSHLNDISSNLAFLQQKVRLLGTAGALQGPTYSFHDPAERKEGFQNPPLPSDAPSTAAGDAATQQDLADFLAKVDGERIRLSASATTDPVVQARVGALTNMRQDIQGILEQLKSKKMLPTEVPVQKADLQKAFPVLGKPSEPLPQILKTLQLPAGLANVLPSNVQKDPATNRMIQQLVDKYADTIVNGISATFQVSYAPPQQTEKARRAQSTVDKMGFPSLADLENVSQAKFLPKDSGRPVTDRLAPLPQDAGRGTAPAHFDWKERARQIEDQVRKRGLRPEDFGVMPRTQKVSEEFSWKGYAKMICTRLQATMDPALPETCGCPPMDWKGWR